MPTDRLEVTHEMMGLQELFELIEDTYGQMDMLTTEEQMIRDGARELARTFDAMCALEERAESSNNHGS